MPSILPFETRCPWRRRRWRRRHVEIKIRGRRRLRVSAGLFQLPAKCAGGPSQVLVLHPKPMHFAILMRSTPEIKRRRRYRNEKARDEQAGGKRQKKWQDSLQHSLIQHAISPLESFYQCLRRLFENVSKIGPNS